MRLNFGSRIVMAALVFLWICRSSGHVGAVEPAADHDEFAVDRRGPGHLEAPPAVRSVRLDGGPAWSTFLLANPGWVARWDGRSGRLVDARGPGASMGVPRIDASNLEHHSRTFLSGRLGPWLPFDEDLELVRSVHAGTRYWAHFAQRVSGVPIWNSRVSLQVLADGRVTRVVNRSYPRVTIDTTPRIGSAEASRLAARDLPADARRDGQPRLVILPMEHASGTEFRLAWEVTWITMTPAGRWVGFVDAGDGVLIWRFNAGYHAEVSGRVTADIQPTTQGDTVVETPLRHLLMSAVGGGLPGPVTVPTDQDGEYLLATPTMIGRQLTVPLAGLYGQVFDGADSFMVPERVFTVPDASPLDFPLRLNATQYPQSGLDAYHFSTVAHDFIRDLDPSLAVIDIPVPIIVNFPLPVANGCNAFWNGSQLVFFTAGDLCANSAQVATVVLHEYGHLVTDLQYRPFFPSGAMHEGFSDYLAATISNQPIVGQGWRPAANPSYIRRIDFDRRFPEDATGQVHNDGLIIASTLWDLREILGASLADSLWHFARYGYADNFDDYFIDFLLTDDDNGNIYDGTPHFGPIVNRFRAHGIGDYAIHVSHVPEKDTEDLGKVFPLTASFLSIFPLVPASVRLHLEIETGGVTTPAVIEMAPTGGVREYTYTLPAQPAGTEVRYWFSAADTAGGTVVWPPEGDDAPFRFQVGTDFRPPTITHDPLEDQPVDDNSRIVRAQVTDNLDRGLGGVTLVYRINGGDSMSVPMTGTPPDFRGALPTAGFVIGDQLEYRIEAADSAMTPNVAHHRESGWHHVEIVRGYGRDFEADAGGAVGGGDWEWGVPGFDLVPPSGQNVWGTVLTGAYHDNLVSTLEFAPIDLSGFTHGSLDFQHHLDTEFFYDGGIIEISADNGMTWQLLNPDGGYPLPHIDASGLPGFSGSFEGWQPVLADLSPWAGTALFRVRLRFFSDAGVTGPGWYIDDVKITDRVARLRPGFVSAASDPDGNVTVSWGLPPGYPEPPAGPVLGYHVYRAALPGGERVRLTGVPLTVRTFQESGLADGQSWEYHVTAVYASGESRAAGPGIASRVRPVYAGDWSLMEADVDSGAVLDTVLVVRNTGTGTLVVNSYAARPGQTIDDVRIRMPLIPFETPWDTLFIDPSESDTLAADLRLIEVRQTADSLLYRLTAWRPWGDPTSDFSVAVELDIDNDLTTGPRGDVFGLLGARALALTGEIQGLFALSGGSGYIHAGPLLTWSIEAGGQTAVIGFDKTGGQAPAEVRVVARVYAGAAATTADRVPDVVNFPWLALGARRHLSIEGGMAANLTFQLGSGTQPPGLVTGAIVLDTSDREMPAVTLPIALNVSSTTAVVFGEFAATPTPKGLELTWTTRDELDHVGFRLVRRTVEPVATDEVAIGPDLIRAGADGAGYRYLDTGAHTGFRYEYRLADVSRTGRVTWHGPFAVTVPGTLVPATMQLSPAAPNPAPGATSIAWAIPAPGAVTLTLFSVDGRTVRSLLRGTTHDAGWHTTAWDGRDDGGDAVPSGVYFYRLEAGGRVAGRKLLIVR